MSTDCVEQLYAPAGKKPYYKLKGPLLELAF